MSLIPETHNLSWVRGTTAHFGFRFRDEDNAPIGDGLTARMQIRTVAGKYGTTEAATLLLELSTDDDTLAWETIEGETALICQLAPADHADLNPLNLKKVKYAYSLELVSGDYVLSPIVGSITVFGETTR